MRATARMMLFDSKMPIAPSGLKAAGTVPNGCASMKVRVLCKVPLKPTLPAVASPEFATSLPVSGRASKSQSHDGIPLGEVPRTSTSTPHSRAAIVAFQMRGFGKYEKMRKSLIYDVLKRESPWSDKRVRSRFTKFHQRAGLRH